MKRVLQVAAVLAVFGLPLVEAGLDVPVVEPPEVMRAYAEAGDPSSQFSYALRCEKGDGVKQDHAAAISWYRKSAAAGFPQAQYNLAVLLATGEGMARDEKEASRWFHAAAAQGMFEAQKAVIQLYTLGLGVEKDAAKAMTWDFIARRSLDLHFQTPAGAPPRPAKLRADGFAEYTTPEDRREAIGPDGSIEHIAPDGSKIVDRPDGAKTAVSSIGIRETKFPDGSVRTEYPNGRRVTRDRHGTVETLNADGTREMEGDGTTSDGKHVRITDKFAKDGTRLSRHIVDGDRIIEELADGGHSVETPGEDEEGHKIRVIEGYDKTGQLSSRRLVRADGVERAGEEIWVVKRWIKKPDGSEERIRQKIGPNNAIYGEEIVEKKAAPPAGKLWDLSHPASNQVLSQGSSVVEHTTEAQKIPIQQVAQIPIDRQVSRMAIGEDVQRTAVPIDKQLTELTKLERDARYFAGATDAQYEAARNSAQHFVFNLPTAPQKAQAGNWLNQRLSDMAAPPPPPPLKEIASDRSDAYPLGVNGSQIIKSYPWKHAETEHFVVHYIQAGEAYPVMRYIECAYFVVTQTLQIDTSASKRKSHVFIFPDKSAWTTFTQTLGFPAAVEGFAYKDELLLGAHEERDTYLKILCHETTHAVVAHFYPGRKWPLWLNEGFAEYMSAKTLALRRSHRLERYLATKVKNPMDVMRVLDRVHYGAVGPFSDVAAFYGESEKCVRTLLEKLPAANFPKFANLAMAENSIQACFSEAYGSDTLKFNALVNASP